MNEKGNPFVATEEKWVDNPTVWVSRCLTKSTKVHRLNEAKSCSRSPINIKPTGSWAYRDQTKTGFVFVKEAPNSEVHTAGIAELRFWIRPDAYNHKVEAQVRVPTDTQILSILPHMHLQARSARCELVAGGVAAAFRSLDRKSDGFVTEEEETRHFGGRRAR
jgi:hypothetical protein